MANYYEQSRSSYFKVKDKGAFQAFLERFGGVVEMIEDLRLRILTKASRLDRPTHVVQLNLQLIPLAGPGIRSADGTV